MAAPVIVIVGILANATTQVLTKPAAWIFFGSWMVMINLPILAAEFRATVWSLWWVVVLALLTWIAVTALNIFIRTTNASQNVKGNKRDRN